MRPDFLDEADPFESVDAAQAAVDAWVANYNAERPHQGLDEKVPVVPADRFIAAASGPNRLEVWLPPALGVAPARDGEPAGTVSAGPEPTRAAVREPGSGAAIELDRAVPGSGKMALCGNQFWLGPARAGQVVRFWIDCEWVHLTIAGSRIKTLRSRFTVNDLDTLPAQSAVSAPAPLPSKPGSGSRARRTVVEVERTMARAGTVSLAQRVVLAAEILAGRRVGIYIEEGAPLLFFDPETRELLRTRPNPLAPGEAARLQRTRPLGSVPRPSTERIRVQRRASNTGIIMVAGQQVALGSIHHYQTVTVLVSETTLAIQLPDADELVVRRTTEQPVCSIKGQRPRTANTATF